MKSFFCSLGLLAGFVGSATAQQGPATRPAAAGAAQAAVWASAARPVGHSANLASAASVAPRRGAAPAAYYGRPRRALQARPAAGQLVPGFGLKAGLNVSSITGNNVIGFDFKNRTSFNAGVMADLPFSNLLSFHPELLYSQKGAKFRGNVEEDNMLISVTGSLRLHYLDLPLLLRLKTNGFFFEAGPQLGYLLGLKREARADVFGLGSLGSSSDTNLDGYRRLDVGYVVGLGYQLPQGLELGLRYNGGFSDLNNPANDPKLRNSVFQAQVGYSFGK